MTPTNPTQFGVLRFIPIESYNDPTRGLDKDARTDKLVETFLSVSDGPARPQSVADWPRVHTAIRRGAEFVIETETPDFTAMLRFNPDQPNQGAYELRHRPRGGVERGRTEQVRAVAADETDSRLSMLTSFSTRYAVVTVGSVRPYARMIWLVGLRDFRTVDHMAQADDPAV